MLANVCVVYEAPRGRYIMCHDVLKSGVAFFERTYIHTHVCVRSVQEPFSLYACLCALGMSAVLRFLCFVPEKVVPSTIALLAQWVSSRIYFVAERHSQQVLVVVLSCQRTMRYALRRAPTRTH